MSRILRCLGLTLFLLSPPALQAQETRGLVLEDFFALEGLGGSVISPAAVSGVSTPTLFVHGEADLRVPFEEAEQMYTALHKQGVPARFIRYPDSYHGGWTPWRLSHRYWSSLQWWDKSLGGDPHDG